MIRTLTRAEVRKLSKELKRLGLRLPRCGYFIKLGSGASAPFRTVEGFEPREVAHDAKGYFFVGWEQL